MDKKPYYRQTAVSFAFITAACVCMTIEFVRCFTGWLWIAAAAFGIAGVVYDVVSAKRLRGNLHSTEHTEHIE